MCCGHKSAPSRTGYSSAPSQRSVARSPQTPPASQSSSATFEYTGATGLTVVSPTTGKRYRFDAPGAQLSVDPRDHSMMLYVPNLRPVRFTRT